jgi:hypothetical protein
MEEASVAVSADVGWRGKRTQIRQQQKKLGIFYRVSDPHRFNAAPDPETAFFLIWDPDPNPDPVPDPGSGCPKIQKNLHLNFLNLSKIAIK